MRYCQSSTTSVVYLTTMIANVVNKKQVIRQRTGEDELQFGPRLHSIASKATQKREAHKGNLIMVKIQFMMNP